MAATDMGVSLSELHN